MAKSKKNIIKKRSRTLKKGGEKIKWSLNGITPMYKLKEPIILTTDINKNELQQITQNSLIEGRVYIFEKNNIIKIGRFNNIIKKGDNNIII
jgi:hypothetical protein